MNRKKIEEWVEALQSGRYAQCTGNYHAGDQFCAIGVGLDVASVEWRATQPVEDGDPTPYMVADDDDPEGWSLDAPGVFKRAYGLTVDDHDHLVNLNDKHRKSLYEIGEHLKYRLKFGYWAGPNADIKVEGLD